MLSTHGPLTTILYRLTVQLHISAALEIVKQKEPSVHSAAEIQCAVQDSVDQVVLAWRSAVLELVALTMTMLV